MNTKEQRILFPDGYDVGAIITTKTTTSEESCHNDRWREFHIAAYVRIPIHGVGLKIRLAEHNLDVERYMG